jgi:hypothetical protein
VGQSNSSEKPVKKSKRKRLAEVLRFLFHVLDKISLRSFVHIPIHVCVAVALAALFYFGQFVTEAINDASLVSILSAVAAASGALLAISLAFGIFRSQYYTDWTYRSRERLRNQRERLEEMMKKSARKYPDISRRLVGQYLLMALYIPGQPISIDEITESDKEFHDWVNARLVKSGKKIDFGDINDYESFEKHVVDAGLIANESRDVLTEVSLAEIHGRSLATLPPLITTWALILVFSLVFALAGGFNVISDRINLSILIVPIYLCFFAGSAIVVDFWGMIHHMRARERGWKLGVSAFIEQYGSGKKE